MTDSIAIAVSGGVDSLVSAYLLKRRGLDVFGIHFLTGYEASGPHGSMTIHRICRQIDLPVVLVDLHGSFKTRVVEYFRSAYRMGKTPNPCLVCNPEIKFGVLLEKARQLGASRLATGHYARVEFGPDGRPRLLTGLDRSKDQSYFLSRLTREQLARACFPLGGWTKSGVRALAAEKGLHPSDRLESQDVCFIKSAHYTDFLAHTRGFQPLPGAIVDTAGRQIGTHDGLHRYTVGQRRGINCPAGQAYYVVRIDVTRNRLVVGFKDSLIADGCRVTGINWIADAPDRPVRVDTRIRYRHRPVPSTISPVGRKEVSVQFDQPQTAVTPGQGAVFYQGDEVVGGGWISDE